MHKFAYALIGLAAIAGTSSLFAQDNAEQLREELAKKLQEERARRLNVEIRGARGVFRPIGPATDNTAAQKQRLIEGDMRRKLLQWYDKDGDGKLNAAEKSAAQLEFLNVLSSLSEPEVQSRIPSDPAASERLRAALEARRRQSEMVFDKNKDGIISDEERDALRAEFARRREQARAEFMKLRDKNGDGLIDEQERDAIRADAEKQRAEFMKEWDKNGDGRIDEQELAALRAELEKQRDELLSKYDENKDGLLSREEMEKARADGAYQGLSNSVFGGPVITLPERVRPPRPRTDTDERPQRPAEK